MNTFKLTVGSLVVTLSAVTLAQHPPPFPQPGAAMLRGATAIVLSDVQTQMEQAFNRLDTNSDGKLNEDEFAHRKQAAKKRLEGKKSNPKASGDWPTRPPGAKLERPRPGMRVNPADLDADGNGSVDFAEFSARLDRLTQLDTNEDGYVTRDEMRAGRAQQQ